jgi:hypothetical protein
VLSPSIYSVHKFSESALKQKKKERGKGPSVDQPVEQASNPHYTSVMSPIALHYKLTRLITIKSTATVTQLL